VALSRALFVCGVEGRGLLLEHRARIRPTYLGPWEFPTTGFFFSLYEMGLGQRAASLIWWAGGPGSEPRCFFSFLSYGALRLTMYTSIHAQRKQKGVCRQWAGRETR